MSSVAALQEALRRDPENVSLWMKMGETLHAHGHTHKALICYERAAQLAPGNVDAAYNRGVMLHLLGRAAQALECYEAVLRLLPRHPAAAANRLAALIALDRPAEAIAGLEEALAGARTPDTLVNLGLARQALGEHALALAAFEEALALDPGHRLAGWNLALAELRRRKLRRGFELYEAHWPGASRAHAARDFGRALWRIGEPLGGRTVLVHADEGLGDTIQYLRFVPGLARDSRRVVLELPRGALPIAGHLGVEVVERASALPATDVHVPLHGLPLRAGASFERLGEAVPYLHADEDRVARWRARLGAHGATTVGIAWRGSASYPDDRLRSIPLSRLRALFGLEGVRLVSLQLDPPAEDLAVLGEPGAPDRIGEQARDLRETAALAAALDLVVSVDTALAHLAGALGRPTWVMLPARSEWRWFDLATESAWYPTATLFRAAHGEAWEDVARRVRSALQRFVKLRP